MILSSKHQVERAQPWLGTLVSVRVQGLPEAAAHRAIDAAFEEIATVHRRMSFHDPTSDLSMLNRSLAGNLVTVDRSTYEVLEQALTFSAASHGCFDVTTGAELVNWGLLPDSPGETRTPGGSCRDMELLGENRVILHSPLCVDLGGIAKGYAVDRATECLRAHGASETVVNAGGDIRVQGQNGELIYLRTEIPEHEVPVLEVTNGSIASSHGSLQKRWHRGRWCGPHVDGARRSPASTDRFVCVTAERCMVADALTKIVMVMGEESSSLLQRFDALAYVHDPGQPWRQLGGPSEAAG